MPFESWLKQTVLRPDLPDGTTINEHGDDSGVISIIRQRSGHTAKDTLHPIRQNVDGCPYVTSDVVAKQCCSLAPQSDVRPRVYRDGSWVSRGLRQPRNDLQCDAGCESGEAATSDSDEGDDDAVSDSDEVDDDTASDDTAADAGHEVDDEKRHSVFMSTVTLGFVDILKQSNSLRSGVRIYKQGVQTQGSVASIWEQLRAAGPVTETQYLRFRQYMKARLTNLISHSKSAIWIADFLTETSTIFSNAGGQISNKPLRDRLKTVSRFLEVVTDLGHVGPLVVSAAGHRLNRFAEITKIKEKDWNTWRESTQRQLHHLTAYIRLLLDPQAAKDIKVTAIDAVSYCEETHVERATLHESAVLSHSQLHPKTARPADIRFACHCEKYKAIRFTNSERGPCHVVVIDKLLPTSASLSPSELREILLTFIPLAVLKKLDEALQAPGREQPGPEAPGSLQSNPLQDLDPLFQLANAAAASNQPLDAYLVTEAGTHSRPRAPADGYGTTSGSTAPRESGSESEPRTGTGTSLHSNVSSENTDYEDGCFPPEPALSSPNATPTGISHTSATVQRQKRPHENHELESSKRPRFVPLTEGCLPAPPILNEVDLEPGIELQGELPNSDEAGARLGGANGYQNGGEHLTPCDNPAAQNPACAGETDAVVSNEGSLFLPLQSSTDSGYTSNVGYRQVPGNRSVALLPDAFVFPSPLLSRRSAHRDPAAAVGEMEGDGDQSFAAARKKRRLQHHQPGSQPTTLEEPRSGAEETIEDSDTTEVSDPAATCRTAPRDSTASGTSSSTADLTQPRMFGEFPQDDSLWTSPNPYDWQHDWGIDGDSIPATSGMLEIGLDEIYKTVSDSEWDKIIEEALGCGWVDTENSISATSGMAQVEDP